VTKPLSRAEWRALGVCICVKNHSPVPLDGEYHHLHPLGEGGPDTRENQVWVCPTTHTNVHELLRLLKQWEGAFTLADARKLYGRTVSPYAYSLARLGWLKIKEARNGPAPV
jgi:hypothetical protein